MSSSVIHFRIMGNLINTMRGGQGNGNTGDDAQADRNNGDDTQEDDRNIEDDGVEDISSGSGDSIYDNIVYGDIDLIVDENGEVVFDSSIGDDTSMDGSDGEVAHAGAAPGVQPNNGRGNTDWFARCRNTNLSQRIMYRDFRASRNPNAAPYLKNEYVLNEFDRFLRVPLELTPVTASRFFGIIRSLYEGNGYRNRAWDVAFLNGQQIKTLDYDFDELIMVAKRTLDVLGDSRHGYLSTSLCHLRRYKHYVFLHNTLTAEELQTVTDWRGMLMNH